MTNKFNNYKELCSVHDEVIKLQKRVQAVCSDMFANDDENFIVVSGFKLGLIEAMCRMNEAMSKYKI